MFLGYDEMKDILNESNFPEIGILSSLALVLFSPSALRLTLHEVSLVWFQAMAGLGMKMFHCRSA